MSKLSRKPVLFLTILVIFFTALSIGYKIGADKQSRTASKYPLLAERIFDKDHGDPLINFEGLRTELREYLKDYKESATLYFEYLPTGTSIRVGDTTTLVGASLLKLPYVLDMYHLAEQKKINLDTEVGLKEEWLNKDFGNLFREGVGYKITYREAARLALEKSDNTAIEVVKSSTEGILNHAKDSSFFALDVDFEYGVDRNVELTARGYSSFLKCLYFACYLSPESSQEVLEYLTNSTVGLDRIPKYIPGDVKIAHKIGSFGNMVQGDCGIVYVERRNYVLCILIQEDEEVGSEMIAKISDKIYKYVSSN